MKVTIKNFRLNKDFFNVNGASLERLGLFNQNTQITLVDPTLTGPEDNETPGSLDTLTMIENPDLAVTAANYLDTAWTSGGWDISTDENIESDIRRWTVRNINILYPDYDNRESDIHTIWMRGNVDGSVYTLVFIYPGNVGPFLANLMTNDSIGDYTVTETNTGTVSFSSGCLTHTTSGEGGSTARAEQDVATNIGDRYEYQFDINSISGNNLTVDVEDTNPVQAVGLLSL